MSDHASHDKEEEGEGVESKGSCDRRLSRAARSLLQQHLQRRLPGGGGMGRRRKDPRDEVDDDVWTLLDDWLRDARPVECPLFSSRDILRHEEEQSIPLKPPSTHSLQYAYPTQTLQERRRTSSQRPQRWWKCGLCFKIFHSRYYMDQHLQTHHVNAWSDDVYHNKEDSTTLVCPAREWCHGLLGDANCHMQALNDEPYYAPGSSGGWGSRLVDHHGHDAHLRLVQHKYEKVARSISCDPSLVQTNCRRMLDQCRVSDLSFCDDLTCPLHHHHSYFKSLSSSNALLQDWQSIWHHESQYYLHSTGILVGIVCCAVVVASIGVYYSYHYYYHDDYFHSSTFEGRGGSNRRLDALDPRTSHRLDASGRFPSRSRNSLQPERSAGHKVHRS